MSDNDAWVWILFLLLIAAVIFTGEPDLHDLLLNKIKCEEKK